MGMPDLMLVHALDSKHLALILMIEMLQLAQKDLSEGSTPDGLDNVEVLPSQMCMERSIEVSFIIPTT
jgi:hypothetical protein